MFDHRQYIDHFLSDHAAGRFSNNSVAKVERTSAVPCFRLIGIHHLTGDQNRSKHNLYLEVVDHNGYRLNEKVDWGWEGQTPQQHPNPVTLDKPPNEPAGNIVVFWGQKVWARVLGKDSDTITDVHSMLPDEDAWNTLGHHSYFCVFLWDEGAAVPAPIEPPLTPPPTDDLVQLQIRYNDLLVRYDKLRAKMSIIKELAS